MSKLNKRMQITQITNQLSSDYHKYKKYYSCNLCSNLYFGTLSERLINGEMVKAERTDISRMKGQIPVKTCLIFYLWKEKLRFILALVPVRYIGNWRES